MKRSKIPPLGAVPRFIWEEARIKELKEAITRFLESNWSIPTEFVYEYNELVGELKEE